MGSGNTKIKDNYKLKLIDDCEHKCNNNTPVQTSRKKSATIVPIDNDSPSSPIGSPNISRISQSNKIDKSRALRGNRISSISSASSIKNGPKGLICSEKCPWIIKNISFPQSPLINDWDIGRIIGTGLMGAVRIVKIKPINGYFALKAIKKDYIYRHRDQRHIDNERNLLLQLRSSFCIRMFGCFQDNNNVYFALEIAAGGELFRRLSKKVYFKADTAKFYATEIFSAIEHVQNLGYVYRDLKPENVMLDEEGHCKLVDFGFAVQPDEEGLIHTICGTPAYLTPEQLNGKFTNGYTHICDFWSFGIFLYGKTPFCRNYRETNYAIYLRVLKGHISFPRGIDSTSKDLISRLCHADINKRLSSLEAIKNHSYFVMDWDDVANRRLLPPFVPRLSANEDNPGHYFDPCGEDKNVPGEGGIWNFDGF